MVVEEGGEAHTIKLRQQCYNEQLVQQGKPRLKLWQWKGAVEKKAHRGRIWKVMGNEQLTQGMWKYFTLARAEVRKILADASLENKKVFKASGSRNLFSESFWSKSQEMRILGIDGTRRRQHQKEEALQLVVCCVWRQVRMESAQQDTGGAARCQYQ